MMSVSHSRNFAVLTLLSFLAVAMFCLWTATAVAADDMNDMSSCISSGTEATLCSANAGNHVSAWQNFFNIIPQKTIDALSLILLLVFVSAIYNVWPRAPEIIYRVLVKNRQTLDIIDPIKRALARGIIQPKIYPSYIG